MYSSLSRSSPESSGDKRDVICWPGFEVKKSMAQMVVQCVLKKGKREKGGKRKEKKKGE